MNTWKLSIRTDSKVPYEQVLEKCKGTSIIAVGWHHAYHDHHPKSLERAKELVRGQWGTWPHQLKYLLEKVVPKDHVWVHQNGRYYLCEVKDDQVLYGRDIDDNFCTFDLGHARRAVWVEVPDKFVSGRIQRGTIAQRTIQRIHLSCREREVNQYIFDNLHNNPGWNPEIDEEKLKRSLSNIGYSDLFSLMTSDDVEDVVAAYLQNKGWILIKSTCFRSKPTFEFAMRDTKGRSARVQVKSGKRQLPPGKYKQFADDQNLIFLFSTHIEDPYPDEGVHNVFAIEHSELVAWIKNNLWAITLPMKMRLWMFFQNHP